MLERYGNNRSDQHHTHTEQEVIEEFYSILHEKPMINYRNDTSKAEMRVELIFKEEGVESIIKLHQVEKLTDPQQDWKICYEAAESTIQQLAQIIAERGIPTEIIYVRRDSDMQFYKKDNLEVIIDFTKVEAHILASARALAPEYAEMSLKEIGENLNARRLQEKSPDLS